MKPRTILGDMEPRQQKGLAVMLIWVVLSYNAVVVIATGRDAAVYEIDRGMDESISPEDQRKDVGLLITVVTNAMLLMSYLLMLVFIIMVLIPLGWLVDDRDMSLSDYYHRRGDAWETDDDDDGEE